MQVFFAIFLLAFAIANAQAAFPDLGKAKAAVQNIFSMLDRVPLIDSEKPGVPAACTDAAIPCRAQPCEAMSLPLSCYAGKELPDLRGEIELRNVHFAYPTRDVPVCGDA